MFWFLDNPISRTKYRDSGFAESLCLTPPPITDYGGTRIFLILYFNENKSKLFRFWNRNRFFRYRFVPESEPPVPVYSGRKRTELKPESNVFLKAYCGGVFSVSGIRLFSFFFVKLFRRIFFCFIHSGNWNGLAAPS